MSTAATLDKDLLATMTPEEQAAIAGADPDEIASLKAVAAGSADTTNDDDDDGADDDGADDGADDAAPAPAAAPAAAAPAPAPAAAPAPAPAPAAADDAPQPFVYRFQAPADFEEQVAANRQAREAVFADLKAGEISVDELPAKLAELDEQARRLDGIRLQAEIAQNQAQQAAEASKAAAVERLFSEAARPENGAIDYRADAKAQKDLDLFVRALAADDANEDKPLKWFLDEAHRRVRALRGDTPAPPPPPPPKADTRRTPPLDAVPQSLANVPGGDATGDVGGEFDDILSLDGEAYEDAIAGMARRDPARFARFQAAR